MFRSESVADGLQSSIRVLMGTAALLGWVHAAQARNLEDGGTTVALRPELAGTVLDEMTVPFHFNEGFGYDIWGTLKSWVVRESELGTLDFYWQIAVTPGSWTGVDRASLSKLPTSVGDPDTGWMLDSPGRVWPGYSYGRATTVEFDLGFGRGFQVTPGTESKAFFVRTDAYDYASDGLAYLSHERNVFDPTIPLQSNSGYVQTFAAAVPEPETYAMVVIGMVLVGSAWRQRARAAGSKLLSVAGAGTGTAHEQVTRMDADSTGD